MRAGSQRKHRRTGAPADGFALADVVVGLAILGISVLGLAGALTTTYGLAERAQQRGRAYEVLTVLVAADPGGEVGWQHAELFVPEAEPAWRDLAAGCLARVVSFDSPAWRRIEVECGPADRRAGRVPIGVWTRP